MATTIPIVEKILSANDRLAAENRAVLEAARVFAINVIASPGAGKTSLIERTVRRLAGPLRVGMINGDLATSLDADRAAAANRARFSAARRSLALIIRSTTGRRLIDI